MPNFRKLFSKKDTSQLFTQGAGFVLRSARQDNGYLFIYDLKKIIHIVIFVSLVSTKSQCNKDFTSMVCSDGLFISLQGTNRKTRGERKKTNGRARRFRLRNILTREDEFHPHLPVFIQLVLLIICYN